MIQHLEPAAGQEIMHILSFVMGAREIEAISFSSCGLGKLSCGLANALSDTLSSSMLPSDRGILSDPEIGHCKCHIS